MISKVSPARAFGLISENVVLISKVSPARALGLLSENVILISKVSPARAFGLVSGNAVLISKVRGARPPIYLPFPSSPRTLQEIEVTRLSVCVATAVESQLRFPTAVESQTCLSVCVPTAVESQALSGRIKHSESLIYPY